MTESGASMLGLPQLGRFDTIAAHSPDRLMACFEGLGNGCEFGNVQRFCGIEPLGLLRFASLPHRMLSNLLRSRFSELPADVAGLKLFPHGADKEWWAGIEKCGIYYHTGQRIGEADEQTLRRNEALKIQFLKRKLLEELEAPEVIFVRLDPGRSVAEMRALHRMLCKYAPHALLWIYPTRNPGKIGEVDILAPGLVRGYIENTAPDAAPSPDAVAVWLTLAEKALAVLKPAVADGLRRLAPSAVPVPADPAWRPSSLAVTRKSQDVPPLPPHHRPVVKHTLVTDTDWDNASLLSFGVTGLVPDTLYTVSAWVWLPPDFNGGVSLVFPGTDALRGWPADPAKAPGWQRIATTIRLPEGLHAHEPGLYVKGRKDSYLYSTGWRFDLGACPADCFGTL